jgi:hypothetical protein
MLFALPSERPKAPWTRPKTCPPLLRFVRGAPPSVAVASCCQHHVSLCGVHSRKRCRFLRPAGANADKSCSVLAGSHCHDGLLHHRAFGLVASRNRTGFAAFHESGTTTHNPHPKMPIMRANARPFPQRCSHPSKKSPRQQPCRVAATVALLPLGPRPVHHTQGMTSRR